MAENSSVITNIAIEEPPRSKQNISISGKYIHQAYTEEFSHNVCLNDMLDLIICIYEFFAKHRIMI